MSKTIVLASNNAGKLAEIQALLAPLDYQLCTQSSLGVTEVAEPHPTFIENCLTKARHAAQYTSLATLSDDSGLCVPSLGGAPGVHSARYAGENTPAHRDQRNNAHLINQLHGSAERAAYYYCVMVYLRHADDPQPIMTEGFWHGMILDAPRGTQGFGYDPLFWLPELGKTAAELDVTAKNQLSHRGQALRHMIIRLGEE
jgi:XTP/dITP diphosphohydrolase